MITSGTILVHGVALLLNFNPNFFTCYCENQAQNCAIAIRYYNNAYYNTVYLNDKAYEPISGEVKYRCERVQQ